METVPSKKKKKLKETVPSKKKKLKEIVPSKPITAESVPAQTSKNECVQSSFCPNPGLCGWSGEMWLQRDVFKSWEQDSLHATKLLAAGLGQVQGTGDLKVGVFLGKKAGLNKRSRNNNGKWGLEKTVCRKKIDLSVNAPDDKIITVLLTLSSALER